MGLSQLEICNQALLKVGADVIDTLTPPASTEDGTKRSIELCNIFFDQSYEEVLRMYPWNSAKMRTTLNLLDADDFVPATITMSGAGEAGQDGTYSIDTEINGKSSWKKDTNKLIKWDGTKWINTFVDGIEVEAYRNDSDTALPPLDGWTTITTNPPPTLGYKILFGYERYATLPADLIRLVDVFRDESMRDERTSWVVEGGYILSDYDTLYMKYIAKPETTELDPLCTNAVICNLAMKLCTALQLDDNWAKRINDELFGIILPQARSIDTIENKELLLEESSWLLNRNYDYPV